MNNRVFYEKYISNIGESAVYYLHPMQRTRLIRILDYFSDTRGRVLDIGCLDGTIGLLIKNDSRDVIGLDISKNATQQAASKGITAMVADAGNTHLPFKENSMDGILAGEVIEHLFDTDGFLCVIG